MKDAYTDPEEEADDFDFDEDAEPITIISCVELRHLEKIASNAMFLLASKLIDPQDEITKNKQQRYTELLDQAVLEYNEWLEKGKSKEDK
jgi:hypothetical protein